MIKQAYINGFIRKCAEHGVDGQKVLEKLAGPRPDERRAIQRITSNPKTLKAMTTPTAAPPRVDDPVWNPANVQKWVTGLGLLPAAVFASRAPAVRDAVDTAVDKAINTPLETGYRYSANGNPIPTTTLDTGGVFGIPAIMAAGGAAMNKIFDFIGRRQASSEQRRRDAAAILSGKQPEKAHFKNSYGIFSD